MGVCSSREFVLLKFKKTGPSIYRTGSNEPSLVTPPNSNGRTIPLNRSARQSVEQFSTHLWRKRKAANRAKISG
jgi:hypothetical protein